MTHSSTQMKAITTKSTNSPFEIKNHTLDLVTGSMSYVGCMKTYFAYYGEVVGIVRTVF
jgi:hypothetical protein